jgi:hypothetical protein
MMGRYLLTHGVTMMAFKSGVEEDQGLGVLTIMMERRVQKSPWE